jgi:PST family polysaccharide transporter
VNILRRLAARVPRLSTLASFGAIQAAQMVLPLLALPYLSRVLGPGPFGTTLYMLTVSAVAAMCVEWGFALGAVREVAVLREDPAALGRAVGDILSAKCLLAVACAVLAVAGWLALSPARQHPWGYALAVANGITLGFNPLWFYQGMGAGVARVAAWEVGGGLAVLLLMLPLVRQPEHWTRYLLLLLLVRAGGYGWLTARIFRQLGLHAGGMRLVDGWRALRATRHLFLAHLGAMAKTHGAPLLLGGVLPARDMGMLIACDKMARGLVSLTMPVTLTLFPELCAARSHGCGGSLLRRTLAWAAVIMGAGAVGVWWLAPWLVTLALGREYAEAAPLLRWLCPLLVLLPLNCVLGTLGLVPRGRERVLTLAIGISALAGLAVAIPLAGMFGTVAGAWLSTGMEGIICAILFVVMHRVDPGLLRIPFRRSRS